MRFIAVTIACAWFAASAVAETRFLTEADDIPLPSGWIERADGVAFDGDSGGIVEASAEGAGGAAAAAQFYRDSLPALGWAIAPGGALQFRRGRERLTIVVRDEGGRTIAAFRLIAQPASMALD